MSAFVLPRLSTSAAVYRWWPVWVGLAALYVPTYVSLNAGAWNQEAQAHGPIVLLVVLWLFWRNRQAFREAPAADALPAAGIALIVCGLLLYTVGRSQSLIFFEVGSHLPLLVGLLLYLQGRAVALKFWFPLLFLLFMVPLPGFIIDGITGPLKEKVSALTATLLWGAGYPVGRTGVMLTVGQYQLLVADACSGLNSMISLSAMGLLYTYLVSAGRGWRSALLLLSILPIAFAANLVRVIALVLVTYHFGDAAGKGFHDSAGMFLYVCALLLIFGFDALLGALGRKRRPA